MSLKKGGFLVGKVYTTCAGPRLWKIISPCFFGDVGTGGTIFSVNSVDCVNEVTLQY